MIDLLRLRISQYRQDRILDELFLNKGTLLSVIKTLHTKYAGDIYKTGLFEELERLESIDTCQTEFEDVLKELRRRLRRDTEVILRLKVRKFSELFDPKNTRISFQNRLLVYLLYKCGGFFPSSSEEARLTREHGITEHGIVRRHGTRRDEQLKRILSSALYDKIEKRRGSAEPDPFSQSDKIMWPGGYFGYPGSSKNAAKLGDDVKQRWRKEYLPGPTALLGTALCASIFGSLRGSHPNDQLRITLHRSINIGDEELLQQTCDYLGMNNAPGASATAARTFPCRNATIGLAYRCRQIVRSKRDVDPEKLKAAMKHLELNEASREMSEGVSFVLAMPLLEPSNNFTSPSPVAGVIYLDSKTEGFFIDNDQLTILASITQHFLESLSSASKNAFERVKNLPLTGIQNNASSRENLPNEVADVIELISTIDPPKTVEPFQFNYDYSDISPVA